ncbi:MAG: sensor histidine kinase [Burkholderiaceae bacterium]|jgi:signal transduction histidine kinase|nr:sensor histidine kinase [Burkholderiaceae bacterium]
MKFKQIHKDLSLVLIVVLVFAGVATMTELQEQVALFSQNYEALQLDELPLTLLVLSLGLWWFAWRRTQEAQAQLQERSRSELKVQELLQHKSDLLQRLYTAKEDERLALARELHDDMGQTSTAIRTEVAVLQRIGRLHPEADESVKRIGESAQHLSQMTRQMLHRLRPPALDSMGLEQALMTLCDNWQQNTQTVCEFKLPTLPEGLNDYACVTVYRIVQEALTNVTRHAHAKHVRVQLTLDSQGLNLNIEDDGRGMADTQAVHPGFGLLGMQERVASVAGSLSISSKLGQGLRLAIQIPRESL